MPEAPRGVNLAGLDVIVRRLGDVTFTTSQANWIALHGAHAIAVEQSPENLTEFVEFIHSELDEALRCATPGFFADIHRSHSSLVTVHISSKVLLCAFASLVDVAKVFERNAFKAMITEDGTQVADRNMLTQARLSFREYLSTLDPEIPLVLERFFGR